MESIKCDSCGGRLVNVIGRGTSTISHVDPHQDRLCKKTKAPRDRFDTATCIECDRVFNLLNETDAAEWAHGHDCEAR